MKVLIFSLAYLPFIGGAEVAIKEITDRISDIDFDMITVNLDGKQKEFEKIGNVNVYRVGSGKGSKYTYPWEAISKAKELNKDYDVVWAMMANQAGIAAMKYKKQNPKVKYFLTLQEGDSLRRIWSRTWFMRGLYKNIYRKADRIQAISKFLALRANKYGYKGHIDLVPNGVDIVNFTKEVEDIRSKLNIQPEDKVVVTSSRLVHKNGVDILIKSVKDLPVKLLILGDGELRSKYEALAKSLDIENKVIFQGHIDHAQLPKYLKISDVYARPSRSEGLGVGFLEAMAAGLPIIGTKIGGIPEFLIDGQTGLFCKVDDDKDLAVKIKQLLDDDNLRQTISKNGQDLIIKNYSWEQVTDKMNDIFNTLTRQNF